MTRPADIALRLPLPPSANRLWRRAGSNLHKAPDYKRWLADVGYRIAVQTAGDFVPIAWRYELRITLPEQRKDPDNLIKPTQDALVACGVIADDRHARRIEVVVDADRPPGTLLVELWSLGARPVPARRRKLVLAA